MENSTVIMIIAAICLVVIIGIIIFVLFIFPGKEGRNKPESITSPSKYIMIQSNIPSSCSSTRRNIQSCSSDNIILRYNENKPDDFLNISVPCGFPGDQESITTFDDSNKIVYMLIGNDCTFDQGKSEKDCDDLPTKCKFERGDVGWVSYKDKADSTKMPVFTKIKGLSNYKGGPEAGFGGNTNLNQTIVFDPDRNKLYKIYFPCGHTDNDLVIQVCMYSKNTVTLTGEYTRNVNNTPPNGDTSTRDVSTLDGFLPGDNTILGSSVSSDPTRFLFTTWTETSSVVTVFNRENLTFAKKKDHFYANALYTASTPVLNNKDFKNGDFYVLSADMNTDQKDRCYSINIYDPEMNNNLGDFIKPTIFERYIYLTLNTNVTPSENSYPIYQMYSIENMLYLPYSSNIFEIDLSAQYTVYLPVKNITYGGFPNERNINDIDDSGSIIVSDSKLYCIASGGKKLQYWKRDNTNPESSEWVVTVNGLYGSDSVTMAVMESNIDQGIIVPKPSTDEKFSCLTSDEHERLNICDEG